MTLPSPPFFYIFKNFILTPAIANSAALCVTKKCKKWGGWVNNPSGFLYEVLTIFKLSIAFSRKLVKNGGVCPILLEYCQKYGT